MVFESLSLNVAPSAVETEHLTDDCCCCCYVGASFKKGAGSPIYICMFFLVSCWCACQICILTGDLEVFFWRAIGWKPFSYQQLPYVGCWLSLCFFR